MACEVNQIFLGEVAAVQNYGAFVRIPGCKQQGLIHKSQISSSHVDDVADILEKGEKVWCKVISIQGDGKVGLSMKFVNQGNGKDLDPNGVQLQLDEQKKKKFNPREERKAIVLEAIYKTTCSKCKTPGHLAKDCFSTPDGKRYELLPEVDDEEPPPPPAAVSQPQTDNRDNVKEKKHKLKKSKKRKKSKSKHVDLGSEESDSPDEKRKKKKKKSKEQKKKKKKQQSTSSDSDSSTDSDNEHESKRHAKKCKYSKARL